MVVLWLFQSLVQYMMWRDRYSWVSQSLLGTLITSHRRWSGCWSFALPFSTRCQYGMFPMEGARLHCYQKVTLKPYLCYGMTRLCTPLHSGNWNAELCTSIAGELLSAQKVSMKEVCHIRSSAFLWLGERASEHHIMSLLKIKVMMNEAFPVTSCDDCCFISSRFVTTLIITSTLTPSIYEFKVVLRYVLLTLKYHILLTISACRFSANSKSALWISQSTGDTLLEVEPILIETISSLL